MTAFKFHGSFYIFGVCKADHFKFGTWVKASTITLLWTVDDAN